jgi:hypothetical protein
MTRTARPQSSRSRAGTAAGRDRAPAEPTTAPQPGDDMPSIRPAVGEHAVTVRRAPGGADEPEAARRDGRQAAHGRAAASRAAPPATRDG